MLSAGLKAFEMRRANRSGVYSYEQRPDTLGEPYQSLLRENTAASDYFNARPRWYKRAAMWWVISAKKEETRLRRLQTLIEDSAHGRTILPLTRKNAPSGGRPRR